MLSFRLIPLFYLLLLGTTPLIAQSGDYPASGASTGHVAKTHGTQLDQPITGLSYYWDSNQQSWGDTAERETYAYIGTNETPANTIRELKINNAWTPNDRTARQWDVDGNLVLQTVDIWSSNQWTLSTEHSYTYDVHGHLEEARVLYGQGPSIPPNESIEQWTNVLDSAGNLVESTLMGKYVNDLTFEPVEKETWTYNSAGEPTDYYHMEWSGNAVGWDTTRHEGDIVWHDFSKNQRTSYTRNVYLQGSFFNAHRYYTIWGANNSYVEYYMQPNPLTAVWDSTAKRQYAVDAYGHPELFEYFEKDTSSSATWEFFSGSNWVNTLNSDGSLMSFDKQDISQNGVFTNIWRWEYLNYPLDILEERLDKGKIAWAPHPIGVQGSLSVESLPGKYSLEIVDVQGRVLRQFSGVHTGGRINHAFELGLSPGLYLYRFVLSGIHQNGRLLVR